MRTLVMHSGCARDDPQGAELRQLCDKSVGHVVNKVVLGGVSGEILQRQNGHRANGGHASSENTTTNSGKIKRKGSGDGCGKSEGKNPCAPPTKRCRALAYQWLCSK